MNKTVLRWLLGLMLVIAVGTAIALRDRFDAAALQAWVEGAGAAGTQLFMAVYALATVLFLPGSVITLAGGVLFGPVWGTLYNLTGATVGAARESWSCCCCSSSRRGRHAWGACRSPCSWV